MPPVSDVRVELGPHRLRRVKERAEPAPKVGVHKLAGALPAEELVVQRLVSTQ